MISRKDVQHIARLARIALTPGEEEKFERELAAILDFVAKLDGVDSASVEPLTGGADLSGVMREDEVRNQKSRTMSQGLLEAAPRKRNGYVEVNAVFEKR